MGPTCTPCVSTGRKCDFVLSASKYALGLSLEQLEKRPGLVDEMLELDPRLFIPFLNSFTLNDDETLYILLYQNFVTKEFSDTFEVAL